MVFNQYFFKFDNAENGNRNLVDLNIGFVLFVEFFGNVMRNFRLYDW